MRYGVANSIQPILWRRLRDEMYSTPQGDKLLDFPVFYAFHKRTENRLLDQNSLANKPPFQASTFYNLVFYHLLLRRFPQR
jgi:hypothetical protein